MSSQCQVFQTPVISTFVVALLLTVGIFISYLPQHIRIIHRKTAEGLSPIFLFLGSASAVSSVINLVLVTATLRRCCSTELTAFQCLNSQTGLIQVAVQALSYCLIPILAVIITRGSPAQDHKQYAEILKVVHMLLAYALVNILAVLVFYLFQPQSLMSFAAFSGVLSLVLGGVQYLPQILTTYKLKHAGSLSVGMMVMQTPGGFLWTLTLYLAPNSTWSSWLPYFTLAVLQGFLLCMCFYYQWTKGTREFAGGDPELDPLIL